MLNNESLDTSDLEKTVKELEAKQDWTKLEQTLRALLAQKPDSLPHLGRLGWALLRLRKFTEAEAAFTRAATFPGPERAANLGGQGICLSSMNRHTEAAPLLRKALDMGFKQTRVQMALASTLDALGEYEEKIKILTDLVKAMPDDAGIHFTLGLNLALVGRYADAIPVLQRSLNLKTINPNQLILYTNVLAAAGKYSEAVDAIHSILRQNFETHNFHMTMSHCLQKLFDDEQRIAVLQAVFGRDPKDAVAAYHLSAELMRVGRLNEAAASMQKCLELAPNSSVAMGLAGRICTERGEYNEAGAYFQKIWDLVAKKLEAWNPGDIEAGTNISVNRIVYLCIEVGSRDLHTRLLLAHFLIKAGFVVVVAGRQALDVAVSELPPGIIVHKSVNGYDRRLVKNAAAVGHAFTAIDEEAFGWTGDDYGMMRVLDVALLPLCDAIFSPGKEYARRIGNQEPSHSDKFVVTGSPRTDLYDPRLRSLHAAEAETMRSRTGPTILICTNFGGWNAAALHYLKMCEVALRAQSAGMNTPRGQWLLETYKEDVWVELRNTAAIREAVKVLADAFPAFRIVIRPHPVEDANTWRRIAAGMKNVDVSPGTLLPTQILASDVMIHVPGCGTGVEGLLLGKPVICLNTVEDLAFPALGISTHTSVTARDMPSLVQLVEQALNEPAKFTTAPEQATARFQDSVALSDKLATEQIAEQIAQIYETHRRVESPGATREGQHALIKDAEKELTLAADVAKLQGLSTPGFGESKKLNRTREQLESEMKMIGDCVGISDPIEIISAGEGTFIMRSVNEQ